MTDLSSQQSNTPQVLKFLNDYRITLSLMQIKSFYANHLSKLNENNDICLKECDNWLDSYFAKKQQLNPDPQQQVFISASQVPLRDKDQYQSEIAKFRLAINDYLMNLGSFIDVKIAQQTKGKDK